METINKTKKILIGVACLLVALLIGFIIYQNLQIRKLSGDVNEEISTGAESAEKDVSVQSEAVHNKADLKTPAAGGSGEVEELEYQLAAAEEELDAANKQLSDDAAQKAENAKNMIEMQKKMLQDPAYQKTLRSSYKGMLEPLYGSLYKELNLSPEKLEQLKELLTDQMLSSMEFSLDMLSATPTEENRNDLQKRIDSLKKENDAEVNALLGSRDFKTYESYRDTLSERQVVSGFAESLGKGDKLTEAQMESLINSMYQERKDVYSLQGWDEERVTLASDMNDEGIAKMMDMNNRTYDGYLEGAGTTLSATQLEQFKAYLKNRSDMTESALKTSAQMYGGQTGQTTNDKKAD